MLGNYIYVQDYIYVYNFNRNLIILQYCCYNLRMFIVTYFTAVYFKEILITASWRWQDNSVETYRSNVKDCLQAQLQNSACACVAWVIYFITMHGVNSLTLLNVISR